MSAEGRGLTFDDLSQAMTDFVADKGWYGEQSVRPQTPRNLVMSMAIELGELLECFQWSDVAPIERVRDELADVILYAVQLANVLGLDLEHAIVTKLDRNLSREWDLAR